MAVKLNARLIESFAGTFLSGRYDDAKPTPDFHRKAWQLYCSDAKQAGVVAPRGHAKSTALTYDYILAEVLFRTAHYVILIGSTEDKAAEQLSNLSEEIETNDDLRREFGVMGFETQQKTEIIVKFDDGSRFRILARGAEQKIRGAMWNGARPDLIVCDDMEDDEQVENKDRRSKFRRWFFRAAKQALSRRGRIRVHGTILHEDSLLSRLMKNKMWQFQFYKAHNSYSDFDGLLWPDQWSAAALRDVQIEFEEDGDSGGYSQEFLNTPLDNNEAFLKKENFLPMSDKDYESEKLYIAGADWAISKADSANRTSFTVGGKDLDNIVHIVGESVGRWDSSQIIEELFDFYQAWRPVAWYVENGQIWLSLKPFILKEMQRRDIWINFVERQPIKDKKSRASSLQKRHKNRGMRFDKQATWYPGYEAELLTFTGITDAVLDDQLDSTALVSIGFDEWAEVDEEDFVEEDEWIARRESKGLRGGQSGQGGRTVAGY